MTLVTEYPVAVVCRVLGYPCTLFYRERRQAEDEALRKAIQQVGERWPRHGYRRITRELRRDGWRVNGKRVLRLMREVGIAGKRVLRRRRTTQSDHPYPRYPNLVRELVVERPDQVWVGDITYVRIPGGFVYVAVLLDVFTRAVRGWHVGRDLSGTLTLTALQRALETGRPEIHHSDQGVQYAAREYVRMLEKAGVRVSMAHVGRAWENGYAERFMRTLKEEEVDLSDYPGARDAEAGIGTFLREVYTHKRIHSALGYLTPAEFEAEWRAHHPESP